MGTVPCRSNAQATLLGAFQELVLQQKRQGVGGLLSVPFTLTRSQGQLLASGHLATSRAHRGLIEGWRLEGHAEVPSGVSPLL